MSTYTDTLESLSSSLTSTIDTISASVDEANSATTRDAYDSSVDSYESAVASYDDLKAQYSAALEAYQNYITAASTFTVDIPNIKDKSQHFSGGSFGINAALPGGAMWSPTALPIMKPGKVSYDRNAQLLLGNMLPFLNWGFGAISGLLMGGQLDLMFDDDLLKTTSYRITVTAVNDTVKETTSVVVELGGDGVIGSEEATTTPETSLSGLQELANAWANRMNITSLLNADPITLTVTIVNLATNKETTVRSIVAGVTLGTLSNAIATTATKAAYKALGITSISAVSLGVSSLVGAVVSEIFELMLGLDNSFGFGGEIDAKASAIFGTAAYRGSEGFLGLGTLTGTLSYSLGFTDSFEYSLFSRNDSLLGFGAESSLGGGFSETFSLETGNTTLTGGSFYDEMLSSVQNSIKEGEIFSQFSELLASPGDFDDDAYYDSLGFEEEFGDPLDTNTGWESFDDAYGGYFGGYDGIGGSDSVGNY